MTISLTLSRYIARQVGIWFGVFFGALSLITLIADLIELLRRSAVHPDVGFGAVLRLALLKLPHTAQELLPFALLFGVIMAFWRLTRSNELIVARAVGVSIWQILAPALAIALALGGFKLGFLNTAAAITYSRFELLEARVMHGQTTATAVAPSGLWLRQATTDGVIMIHAARVAPDLASMETVLVLRYDHDRRFLSRIDAANARLEPGLWVFEKAVEAEGQHPQRPVGTLRIPTEFTAEKIQESFAKPDTMPFWALPAFIDLLERAGFSSVPHRLYLYSQLAVPLLLASMVLIAATFSLRPTRRGGVGLMIGGGITAGFMIYFLSYLVQSLGQGTQIPVALAAWAPAIVSTLVGLVMLLHLEDG